MIGWECSYYQRDKGCIENFSGKFLGKRTLRRSRRGWEFSTMMDLRDVMCDGRKWVKMDQGHNQWRSLFSFRFL
jgi:hypothetical protein